MSNAANQTNSLQQTLRQASADEGRIGPAERPITLAEATRHLPGSHGKKMSKVSGPLSLEPLESPAEPPPGILSWPEQPCSQKSGWKSAQKARKRFRENDLLKPCDTLHL